jgi:hypothetical protein
MTAASGAISESADVGEDDWLVAVVLLVAMVAPLGNGLWAACELLEARSGPLPEGRDPLLCAEITPASVMTQVTTSMEWRIENSSLKLMGGIHRHGTIFIV